ncbi:hypothetical protein BN2537_6629 [Streptomyces venezuelae]|nr:hypothetical protein BN2537_6629 [Streptomyces venezuelae]
MIGAGRGQPPSDPHFPRVPRCRPTPCHRCSRTGPGNSG